MTSMTRHCSQLYDTGFCKQSLASVAQPVEHRSVERDGPVSQRKLQHRLLSGVTRKLGRLAREELEGEARLHFETPVICRLEQPFAIRSACNLIR
jgi:hypothetical protein